MSIIDLTQVTQFITTMCKLHKTNTLSARSKTLERGCWSDMVLLLCRNAKEIFRKGSHVFILFSLAKIAGEEVYESLAIQGSQCQVFNELIQRRCWVNCSQCSVDGGINCGLVSNSSIQLVFGWQRTLRSKILVDIHDL